MNAFKLRERRQVLRALAATSAGIVLPVGAATAPAQTGWKPTQTVTYEIGVAPGGSVDLYARGIKNELERLKLVNNQLVVAENRPGAGGLLALQVLQRNRGNGHYVGTFHTGFIAGQLTGILKADVREYVPVAMLVQETTLVAVRADSPLKTAGDLLDALKKEPTSIKIAVAPLRGMNIHLAIAKPLKTAGVDVAKLTIAPFRSSGESMTALLGGHVDVVSATGPTVVPLVQAGKVRMLASAAREHGTGALASVPTWHELGVASEYVSYNGILLPPAVDADQIRFWEQALKQVSQSAEWIELVEKSGNKPMFKGYVDSHRYMQEEFKATQATLADIGMLTQ